LKTDSAIAHPPDASHQLFLKFYKLDGLKLFVVKFRVFIKIVDGAPVTEIEGIAVCENDDPYRLLRILIGSALI
jgi:hypothetical protein